jgi:O-antigen ligase
MLSGGGGVTSALGRSSDFSGRTEIWAAAIASADSPLFGTGFESFWNKNAQKVVAILWYYTGLGNLNSAHDGYLQIYLDLGWCGVCSLLTILIVGYTKAIKAFQCNRELGGLFLAYLITCLFYNITEAGFRIMTPSWISLLLSVIGASGVTIGLVKTDVRKLSTSRARSTRTLAADDERLPEERSVYALQGAANRILESTAGSVPRTNAF